MTHKLSPHFNTINQLLVEIKDQGITDIKLSKHLKESIKLRKLFKNLLASNPKWSAENQPYISNIVHAVYPEAEQNWTISKVTRKITRLAKKKEIVPLTLKDNLKLLISQQRSLEVQQLLRSSTDAFNIRELLRSINPPIAFQGTILETLLHHFPKYHREIFLYALQSGSPLEKALQLNDRKRVLFLIDTCPIQMFERLIRNCPKETLSQALERKEQGKTVLDTLYERNQCEKLELLLTTCPEQSTTFLKDLTKSTKLLERACQYGNIEVAKLILKQWGRKINYSSFVSLAVFFSQSEMVKLFIDCCPKGRLNSQLKSLFTKSVTSGDVAMAKFLLTYCSPKLKREIFKPDALNQSLLHIHINENPSREMVRLLVTSCPLDMKKALFQHDIHGYNPLYAAIKKQNVGIVEELLDQAVKNGLDLASLVNVSKGGTNALNLAISYKDIKIARAVLNGVSPAVKSLLFAPSTAWDGPIEASVKTKSPEMTELVLNEYPDKDTFAADYKRTLRFIKSVLIEEYSDEEIASQLNHLIDHCPDNMVADCFGLYIGFENILYFSITCGDLLLVQKIVNKCDKQQLDTLLEDNEGLHTFIDKALQDENFDLVLFLLENCPTQAAKELLDEYLLDQEPLFPIINKTPHGQLSRVIKALLPLANVNQFISELPDIVEYAPCFLELLSEIELSGESAAKRDVILAYGYLTIDLDHDLALTMIRDFAAKPEIYIPHVLETPKLLEALLDDNPDCVKNFIEQKGGADHLDQKTKEALLSLLSPSEIYETIDSIPVEEKELRLGATHRTADKVGTAQEILEEILYQNIPTTGQSTLPLVLSYYLPMLPTATISLLAEESPDLIKALVPYLSDSYLACVIPIFKTKELKTISKTTNPSYVSFMRLEQKKEILEGTPFTPKGSQMFREKKNKFLELINVTKNTPSSVATLVDEFYSYKTTLFPVLPHLRQALRMAASFAPIQVDQTLADKLQIQPQIVSYTKDQVPATFSNQVLQRFKAALNTISEMEKEFLLLEAKIKEFEEEFGLKEVEHPEEFVDPISGELMVEPWCISDGQVNYTVDRKSLISMEQHVPGMIRHPITRKPVPLLNCYNDKTLQAKIQAYALTGPDSREE